MPGYILLYFFSSVYLAFCVSHIYWFLNFWVLFRHIEFLKDINQIRLMFLRRAEIRFSRKLSVVSLARSTNFVLIERLST